MLVDLIRQGQLSSKDLAEELGVSEPTVNRDIEFLRSKGYEIKAIRVARKWAYQIIEALIVREEKASKHRKGDR